MMCGCVHARTRERESNSKYNFISDSKSCKQQTRILFHKHSDHTWCVSSCVHVPERVGVHVYLCLHDNNENHTADKTLLSDSKLYTQKTRLLFLLTEQ
jgi:hypothetical protein